MVDQKIKGINREGDNRTGNRKKSRKELNNRQREQKTEGTDKNIFQNCRMKKYRKNKKRRKKKTK